MSVAGDRTKRRILEAAYQLFYRDGFSRVGVDAIAEKAGITKRTLYYHFESKDKLLGEVLDLQHDLAMQRIETWAGRRNSDPLQVIDMLFADLRAWAEKPRWQGSGFTRMAMELAGLPGHPARAAARRHKQAVEDRLAAQFAMLGLTSSQKLAREIRLLTEGCISLMLIHQDSSYADAARAAARRLIAQELPTNAPVMSAEDSRVS